MSRISQNAESFPKSINEVDTMDVGVEYMHLNTADETCSESSQLLNNNASYTTTFWLGKVVLLTWAVVTVLVLIYSSTIAEYVRDIAAKCAEHGELLFLYYTLLFSLTVPLFMSIEVLAVAAGFIFSRVYGKALGITLCALNTFLAYIIAMSICFLLSRYLIYDFANRHLRNHRYYNALSKALEKEGFKIVIVIRFSPFLPAAICSYILGTMNITFLKFNLGSIGALPSFFYYSYLGSLFEDLASQEQYGLRTFIYILVSIVITIVGVYYAYVLTNRYIPTDITTEEDEEYQN